MQRGSLDDLRALVSVGHERSFTKAAARLGVSQSALSQTIRQLEARLGVRRLVAQSIAWTYAPGPQPHTEDDPLDLHAEGDRAITMEGVAALERLTLSSPPILGTVLRYGRLYGPGTGVHSVPEAPSLHVDAAASAALLAIEKGCPGVYNIAEQDGYLTTAKARRELGFDPDFRLEARV
jgi:nucleoside-diphosphate-sugar epimerase